MINRWVSAYRVVYSVNGGCGDNIFLFMRITVRAIAYLMGKNGILFFYRGSFIIFSAVYSA